MYARKSQQQDKLSAMALMLTMPFSKGLPRPPRRGRLWPTQSIWNPRGNQIMMSLLWKYEIISMHFHEKQIKNFCSYKWKVPLLKNQKILSHYLLTGSEKPINSWVIAMHVVRHFKNGERRPGFPFSGTSILSKVTIATWLRSCY